MSPFAKYVLSGFRNGVLKKLYIHIYIYKNTNIFGLIDNLRDMFIILSNNIALEVYLSTRC